MVSPENCLRCDCNFLSCRRPDYCLGPHLRQMLSYGCTRLEIGVQSTYEDVARDTNRGHTVAAVADCFCLAKDAGFKVSLVPYHKTCSPSLVEKCIWAFLYSLETNLSSMQSATKIVSLKIVLKLCCAFT